MADPPVSPAAADDPAGGQEILSIVLDKPTRDGDVEIHLLTNVPAKDARARVIAELYRKRWLIETAFAELEEFIDLPVRTYSSGMTMRLGFAVAAHLEADGTAGLAMINTFVATAAGAFAWMLMERFAGHKASALGFASGVIAASGTCSRISATRSRNRSRV